jgi:hypothetical protein
LEIQLGLLMGLERVALKDVVEADKMGKQLGML